MRRNEYFQTERYPLLTGDMEQSLMRLVKENGDQTAKWELVRGNYRFLLKQANSIDPRNADELAQVGAIDLLGAIDSYDPSRYSCRLYSYASRGTYRAMIHFHKRHIRPARQVEVSDPAAMLDAMRLAEESSENETGDIDRLHCAMQLLTEAQRTLISLRTTGVPIAKIAQRLGFSRSTLQRRWDEVIEDLKVAWHCQPCE